MDALWKVKITLGAIAASKININKLISMPVSSWGRNRRIWKVFERVNSNWNFQARGCQRIVVTSETNILDIFWNNILRKMPMSRLGLMVRLNRLLYTEIFFLMEKNQVYNLNCKIWSIGAPELHSLLQG